MDTPVRFRFAEREDTPLVLEFIIELARYEKLEDQVVADVETLERELFDEGGAQVLIAEVDGQPVGFALFFHNFSTFLGRRGLYLEDLYVRPAWRGRGIGRALLARLARIACERGCGRLEWWCRSLGAEAMDEWTVYRIAGDTLRHLAHESAPE